MNALKLISQVVFTRSSGFILELIQNAEDAGLGSSSPGMFEITLNQKRIKISHNGRPFTEDDVRALCGIRSSKKPEKGTLGYLGIDLDAIENQETKRIDVRLEPFGDITRLSVFDNGPGLSGRLLERPAYRHPSCRPCSVVCTSERVPPVHAGT